MQNVLILSAGVTTGWHLVRVAQQYFSDKIRLYLCDTNPRDLVPAASQVADYHQVPPLVAPEYKEVICHILKANGIQTIIPLIDQDLFHWAQDAPELDALGVRSTAPPMHTLHLLSDKQQMFCFLRKNNLPTPALIVPEEREPRRQYIVKKKVGCGSHGLRLVNGTQPLTLAEDELLQERCDGNGVEVTAEVFNAQGRVKVFCRQRVTTKAGVCTKMVPLHIPEIERYMETLVHLLPCPVAFCAQFMQHRGQWNMIDCNLRVGAGTALATAAGFQLVRAMWAEVCGASVPDQWLQPDPTVKAVLRVYEEVVIR